MSAANTPIAKIFVVDTPKGSGFLEKCIRENEMVPYINESGSNKLSMIFQYDQNRRRELKPASGDHYYNPMLARLQTIATNKNCNIIYWSSENSRCTLRAFGDSDEIRRKLSTILPKNGLPTVVLLTACNTAQSAKDLNNPESEGNNNMNNSENIVFTANGNINMKATEALQKRIIRKRILQYERDMINYRRSERENDPTIQESEDPLFLGFNGQIHRYKDNIYICNYPLETFPMLMCKGPGMGNVGNLRNEFGNISNTARAREEEKIKCCISRVDGFSKFFVEQFKGERECTQVDWAKLEARVENILSKKNARNTITLDDSSVRLHDPRRAAAPSDGTFCQSTERNTNPCGIANDFDNSQSQEHSARIDKEKRIWGELMADLRTKRDDRHRMNFGTRGSRFNALFDSIDWASMTPEAVTALVNTKDQHGRTALYMVLDEAQGFQGALKQTIVTKLLEKNASIDLIYNAEKDLDTVIGYDEKERAAYTKTIQELLFYTKNSDVKRFTKGYLLDGRINFYTMPYFEKKLEYSEIPGENSAEKLMKTAVKEVKTNFITYTQEIIKELINLASSKPLRVESAELVERVGGKYEIDLIKVIEATPHVFESENIFDLAVRALNVLNGVADRVGKPDEKVYAFLKRNILQLGKSIQRAKNVIPLSTNVANNAAVVAAPVVRETEEERRARIAADIAQKRAEAAARKAAKNAAAAAARDAAGAGNGGHAGGARRRNHRVTRNRKNRKTTRRNRKSQTRKH